MESRQTKVALQRVKTFQARNRTKSPESFEMRVDLGHLALLAAAESALDAIADSGELAREGPSMNRDQMHGFFLVTMSTEVDGRASVLAFDAEFGRVTNAAVFRQEELDLIVANREDLRIPGTTALLAAPRLHIP